MQAEALRLQLPKPGHFNVKYCCYNSQKSQSTVVYLAAPRHLGSSVEEICLQPVYAVES